MGIDLWQTRAPTPSFLARTGSKDRELWRVLAFPVLWSSLGLVIGAALYFTAMSLSDELSRLFPSTAYGLRAAPLGRVRPEQVAPNLGLMGEARRLLLLASGPAGFAISTPLIGRWLMQRPALTWFTAAHRFRWRMLLAGLVMYCAATGLMMLVGGLAHGFPKSPPLFRTDEPLHVRGVYLLVSTAALLAAAAAEEVILRGWLLQQTAAFTRKLVIVLAFNAVLFAFIALFVSGVSLGIIALRTGGLEFGIGVHAGNNLMLAWFVTTFPVGDLTGQMRLGDLIAQLIVTFAGLGLAELTVRWRPLRRIAFWT